MKTTITVNKLRRKNCNKEKAVKKREKQRQFRTFVQGMRLL